MVEQREKQGGTSFVKLRNHLQSPLKSCEAICDEIEEKMASMGFPLEFMTYFSDAGLQSGDQNIEAFFMSPEYF